jgi:alkylation response protein AidB-like acyl-CoA dehydrogenase
MSLLNQAVSIAKEAELRKQEIEKLRNTPADIIDKIKSAGLVKMWAIKSCGGSETPVSKVSNIISSMAEYNGSLAWITAVTNCSSLITGFISEEMADTLFQSPVAMVGGFAGPSGAATIENEHLLVSGHWSWGSGISHCSHIVGGVFLKDGEKTKGAAVVFFTPEEIELLDNWHVLGLKGTNSVDYIAENCRIPNDRWTVFPVEEARHNSPLYQFSFLGALSVSVASVSVGFATRAVKELQELAQVKKPFGQGKPLCLRSNFQEHFGRLNASLQATKLYLDQSIKKIEDQILSGSHNTRSKADIRLASAYCTEKASDIVKECYQLAGGSAIWQSGKLEELMRDCHVVTQHGMVNRSNYRTGGAVHLGQEVPKVIL